MLSLFKTLLFQNPLFTCMCAVFYNAELNELKQSFNFIFPFIIVKNKTKTSSVFECAPCKFHILFYSMDNSGAAKLGPGRGQLSSPCIGVAVFRHLCWVRE